MFKLFTFILISISFTACFSPVKPSINIKKDMHYLKPSHANNLSYGHVQIFAGPNCNNRITSTSGGKIYLECSTRYKWNTTTRIFRINSQEPEIMKYVLNNFNNPVPYGSTAYKVYLERKFNKDYKNYAEVIIKQIDVNNQVVEYIDYSYYIDQLNKALLTYDKKKGLSSISFLPKKFIRASYMKSYLKALENAKTNREVDILAVIDRKARNNKHSHIQRDNQKNIIRFTQKYHYYLNKAPESELTKVINKLKNLRNINKKELKKVIQRRDKLKKSRLKKQEINKDKAKKRAYNKKMKRIKYEFDKAVRTNTLHAYDFFIKKYTGDKDLKDFVKKAKTKYKILILRDI
jgi:hypothetical protein